MSVGDGDPAHASDVWLRVLTADYWKRDGKLHNNAFTGSGLSPPREPKPYTLEFSGRLLSKTKDVETEAKTFCIPPLQFHGIVFQKVENLRSDGEAEHKPAGCKTDVIFTPKKTDAAHADVVAYGPTLEHRYLIREWLQTFIQFARPGGCNIIEELRPTIAAE